MSSGGQSYRSRWDQRFRDCAIIDGIKGSAQNTLRLMATYANADGTSIRVGQETLAAKQGIDVRTVRRHQKQGEEAGWIVCQYHGRGPGDPSIHRLNIASEEISPDTSVRSYGKKHRTPVSADISDHRTFEAVSPDISRNITGHQCPPTMGTMGTMPRPPSGRAPKTPIRPSDIDLRGAPEFDSYDADEFDALTYVEKCKAVIAGLAPKAWL